MDRPTMIRSFNEWMRRYIEEPDRFSREFRDVQEFLRDEAAGKEPDYGQDCAAYLTLIAAEIAPAVGAPVAASLD